MLKHHNYGALERKVYEKQYVCSPQLARSCCFSKRKNFFLFKRRNNYGTTTGPKALCFAVLWVSGVVVVYVFIHLRHYPRWKIKTQVARCTVSLCQCQTIGTLRWAVLIIDVAIRLAKRQGYTEWRMFNATLIGHFKANYRLYVSHRKGLNKCACSILLKWNQFLSSNAESVTAHAIGFLLTTRDDINLKNLHVYGLCKAVAAVLNIYTSTCLGW